jgi:hypothetical protein
MLVEERRAETAYVVAAPSTQPHASSVDPIKDID